MEPPSLARETVPAIVPVLAWVTVKVTPLLGIPPTVTSTGPVVAPAGRGATMLVPLQLLGVAAKPSKVTVLVPWVAPKLEPPMVTEAPTRPDGGERLLMVGAAFMLKLTVVVTPPLTVIPLCL